MTDLADITRHWSPKRRERAALALRAARTRTDIVNRVQHPAELAALCDPGYRITPAVLKVSQAVERVLRGRRKNLLITAPPQEFKSYLCAVWTPLRALQLHPHWRIMLLTYADGLAEEHGGLARSMIRQYGTGVVDAFTGSPLPDRLGYSLAADKATAGYWRIAQGGGGMVSAGRDATITGRRADLLIIDDPYKGMQEADSEAIRRKVDSWYRSTTQTRLAAGSSTILIQTRWHPDDLAGTILKEQAALPPELRTWRYINVPAVANGIFPDALDRPAGVPLESARGRTPDDWADIERTVGKRVWNALYQGSPTPPEGGLFSQAWFDAHRLHTMPERTLLRVVAVDPSESGHGDEAGVVAAALLPGNKVAFTHDRSSQMTSEQWAAAAVQLALDTDASIIFIETYTAGTTYTNVVRRHLADRLRTETDELLRVRLAHLAHRVRGWHETGDAVARSGLLRQACEVGTAVMVGQQMALFETQARLWQAGQHQPDRVAAAVIAHDRLVKMAGQQAQVASPVRARGVGGAQAAWLGRKVG